MATLETLNALLDRAATNPDMGLRFADRRERATFLSWQVLRMDAERVARGLQGLGIELGERVALIYPTEPDFFRAYFGVLLAGGVPVPLYPPVRLGRLEEYHERTAGMIIAAGCRLVLAGRRVRRILGETVMRSRLAFGCRDLSSLDAEASSIWSPPALAGETLALVQFSSGTTTEPKPVALSHRALLAQVRALDDHWRDPSEQPTGVSWLPLYHDMGLIGCALTALELPSVMTLLPPEAFVVRPALWLRAIGHYRANISVAPNFAYALAAQKIRDEDMEGVDLSCWQHALCGAEPVSPSVLRQFQDRFARWGLRPEALTPVYGLSEAALAVTFGRLDQPFHTARFDRNALAEGHATRSLEDDNSSELVSAGRPLAGFETRIVDASGEPLPCAQIGRITVRGPSLMSGYLDRPDLTAQSMQGGWLDTGDLGFIDDVGRLFLTGRAKDIIIVRGRNHDPAPIEHAASGVAGARAGCAVAVSDPSPDMGSERLLILVELARDARAEDRKTLASRVTDAILRATGLAADHVEVLLPGTLPRTSSGKLRRREALRRFSDGTLNPPASSGLLTIGGAMLRSARAYRRAGREDEP